MKIELEIVKLSNDVVTESNPTGGGCADPSLPQEWGGDAPNCGGTVVE